MSLLTYILMCICFNCLFVVWQQLKSFQKLVKIFQYIHRHKNLHLINSVMADFHTNLKISEHIFEIDLNAINLFSVDK